MNDKQTQTPEGNQSRQEKNSSNTREIDNFLTMR